MGTLVIAATSLEAGLLQGSLPVGTELVIGGMGAVNTAHALTRAFTVDGLPDLVIQTGIAGAFVPAEVPVGSVVLATEEVYADVGVITRDGWLSSEAIGIPLVAQTARQPARFNHFPLDTKLVERATAACGPLVTRTGRFITLSQVTGVRAVGDDLHARFGALCESMEGAAAAHVCALYDVPFLELRGISNLVEDRDRSKWRIKEAAEAAQRATLRLLEHVDKVLVR